MDHERLQAIFQEMGKPDHPIYHLRNLYASQEATIRTRHKTADQFHIEKGVCQGHILSTSLLGHHAKCQAE